MRQTVQAITLVCAVLVGVAGVGRIDSVEAQAVTCFGQAATIVQTGGTVVGTGGADVIVAINADLVRGYGGGDRICTGSEVSSGVVTVINAGGGDDFVDACDSAGLLTDTFLCAREVRGGSGNDKVRDAYLAYGDSGNDEVADSFFAYGGAGNDLIVVIELFSSTLCDGGSGIDALGGHATCDSVVNVP